MDVSSSDFEERKIVLRRDQQNYREQFDNRILFSIKILLIYNRKIHSN